jgi:hypothetical protein
VNGLLWQPVLGFHPVGLGLDLSEDYLDEDSVQALEAVISAELGLP